MFDSSKVKAYYQLIKPGVMYGNVLTAVSGFLFASALAGYMDVKLFFAMLIGMTAVVSSACVINNYLDKDIDSIMARTKKRPSVTGVVPSKNILIFGIILGVVGFVTLYLWTNTLTLLVGIVGFVTYVWLYGMWSKRVSVHGTVVGSISGAMPIVGGYASVVGEIDLAFVILFFVLFFWQFPEFYSIAIYRKKEYLAAKVPVISVVKGVDHTIKQIFAYTVLYVMATISLYFFGYVGDSYLLVMVVSGFYWIYLGYSGLATKDADKWSRSMFKFSMIEILLICFMLPLGVILP